ncbi:MAG TPA: hypothetical protein VFQ53_07960 [Kofleriaceae bacterium]|nr:hypothetical protein [Kofleriaceae bacterium]
MRWLVAIALVSLAGVADASVAIRIAPGPGAPRDPARRDHPYSRFRDVAFEAYCPHTTDPNPVVVIAPDLGARFEQANVAATQLAEAGLHVIVVAPPREPARYPDALEQALASEPDAREPGCQRTDVIGAIGIGAGGGAAVRALATRRPLAAVLTILDEAARDVPETPTLAIAATGTPSRTRFVVVDATPCDVDSDPLPCRAPPPPGETAEHAQDRWELHRLRMAAIYARTVAFVAAYVGGDDALRDASAAWETQYVATPPDHTADRARPKQNFVFLSVPGLLGGASHDGAGLLTGLRGELIFARLVSERSLHHVGRGHGLGIYGELLRVDDEPVVGAGLTYASYTSGIALVPSVGVYRRSGEVVDRGIAAGAFLGFRHSFRDFDRIDLPIGFRVDTRFGRDGERSVEVSAEIDLVAFALVGSALGWALGL